MKKLFLSLAFIASAFMLNAQTIFNGGIYTNTTLTLANSPYLMTGSVVVFPGVTLTIEPGVEVRVEKFSNNATVPYTLEVRGTLYMVGQPGLPITFVGDTTGTAQDTWNGIYIKNGQGGQLLGFDYVNISNAYQSVGYESTTTDVFDLHDCNFKYNGIGINVTTSVTADNCTFIGNGAGISGWSNFTLTNCILDSNNSALSIYPTAVSMKNCQLNYNNIGMGFNASVFSSMLIDSSTFTHNNLAVYAPNGGSITNCDFNNNVWALGYTYDLFVDNCSIQFNELGIDAGSDVTVQNSDISNNLVGVGLGPITFGMVMPLVQNNYICNNTQYNVENKTDLNLTLASNCFCESDSTVIEEKIYDGYDDITRGLISYAIYDSSCSTILQYVNKFPTSVEEIYASQISLQPNPATNYCSIVTSNLAGQNGFINISDASGKTIYSQIINADRIDIATDSFVAGVYHVSISADNNFIAHKKLVVLK